MANPIGHGTPDKQGANCFWPKVFQLFIAGYLSLCKKNLKPLAGADIIFMQN